MYRMKKIRLIIFDIDGVLTDGNVYVDAEGKETKRFRLTEIDALNSIRALGLDVCAITGEDTPITEVFQKKTEWKVFAKGCKDKLSEVIKIEQRLGLNSSEICYIGDGKYDVEAIRHAGVGVCPQNAIREAKEAADIVLDGRGGESCVYELFQRLKEGGL